MNIPDQPVAISHQIHTHTEFRQQIHDDLQMQHPEWVRLNGESPRCDSSVYYPCKVLILTTDGARSLWPGSPKPVPYKL
jgi:hypothetical protein